MSSLVVVLSAGLSLAQEKEEEKLSKEQIAAGQREVNSELSSLAQELAKNLSHPGFRGQLRAAIAQSKNREQILELESFLGKSVGRPDAPPGLKKLQESAKRANSKLKSSGVWGIEGLDLYFPVKEHREKWKGGSDILVAFSPVNNEVDITEIVAYSVKTGERIVLDPEKAPQTLTIVIAPEEHESHEVEAAPQTKEIRPSEDRKPDLEGRDPPEPKVKHEDENSYVGLKWLKIYNPQEWWFEGAPEVYVLFGIRKYNDCYYDGYSYKWLSFIDNTHTWYYTWPYTRWYFSSAYYNKMLVYILERDGGSYDPLLHQIYPGITCGWTFRDSEDETIDNTWMWRGNFPYNYDYYHYIGDAYLIWYKTQ